MYICNAYLHVCKVIVKNKLHEINSFVFVCTLKYGVVGEVLASPLQSLRPCAYLDDVCLFHDDDRLDFLRIRGKVFEQFHLGLERLANK